MGLYRVEALQSIAAMAVVSMASAWSLGVLGVRGAPRVRFSDRQAVRIVEFAMRVCSATTTTAGGSPHALESATIELLY